MTTSVLASNSSPQCQVSFIFCRHNRTIFAALANLGLLALASLLSIALHAAENTRQPQAELDAVNSAIADIQGWLQEAQASYSVEQANLRAAELQIDSTSRELNEIQQALATATAEQQDLQQQLTALEADKTSQQQMLEQVLRAAYMQGESNLLKMMFNQEDPARSARMLHYYSVFATTQIEVVLRYQTTLDSIAQTQSNLAAVAEQLQMQQTKLQAEAEALALGKQSRQAALAQLQRSIAARNDELEQLQIDQQQLQQLITEINRAIERIPPPSPRSPFSAQKGALSQPAPGSIVANFAAQYGDGNLRRQGISIATPEGTPVQAVHGGRVVFADWLRGTGLLVIIDHGDGYMSLYGNNQALAVEAGAQVNSGQVIATAGGAGRNNGTGSPSEQALYFEIRHHGTPQNPTDWLR